MLNREKLFRYELKLLYKDHFVRGYFLKIDVSPLRETLNCKEESKRRFYYLCIQHWRFLNYTGVRMV